MIEEYEQSISEFFEAFRQGLDAPSTQLPERVEVSRDAEFAAFAAGVHDRDPIGLPAEYWDQLGVPYGMFDDWPWFDYIDGKTASMRPHGRETRQLVTNAINRVHEWNHQLRSILVELGAILLLDSIITCTQIVVWNRINGRGDDEFANRIEAIMLCGGIPIGFVRGVEDGDIFVFWPHPIEPSVGSVREA